MFKILSKEKLAPKEYSFWIDAPRIASHAKPGQFVSVRASETGERIPLTIADFDAEKGRIRLIFQVVGKSTALMSQLEAGDEIKDVAGPLGKASETDKFGTVLLIGGGIGIAAIYPILRRLKQLGSRVIAILGARTAELVILREECKKYCDELIITTDDGSLGEKGLVTDAMKRLAQRGEKPDRCWCVGPSVMMKFCQKTAKELGWPIWVSLNPLMLDGTGMCGCCRVTIDGEIKFACVDGPEFDGHKVDWTEFMNRLAQYRDEEKISMEKYEAETGEKSWL